MMIYKVKGDEKQDWGLGDRSSIRGRRQRTFYFIPFFFPKYNVILLYKENN